MRDTRLVSMTRRKGARAAATTPVATSMLSATTLGAAREGRDLASPHKMGGTAAMAAATGSVR